MTLLTERMSRGAAKAAMDSIAQRQVLADVTQRNAEIIRALGMMDRFTVRWSQANERYLRENIRATDVSCQSRIGRQGSALCAAVGNAGPWRLSRGRRQSFGRHHDRVIDHDGPGAGAGRGRARQLEATDRRASGHCAPARYLQGDREASGAAGGLAASEPRTLGAGSRGGGTRYRQADRVEYFLFAQGRHGARAAGRERVGKNLAVKGAGGNLAARHGVVRLDGAAIDQWSNQDLGRHVGYLPQDVALFDGTVAENICRFDDARDSDAILKAAQIAGVHDIILRLPEGYSTRIGQGGMSLSAGQRQRIGLARAVFGDPFLVVLDEPNANLDADGENALGRAILVLRQNNASSSSYRIGRACWRR